MTNARPVFADFYVESWPALSAYCQSFGADGPTADDVAQEAFTRVYVRYPLLADPRPYLFRTARNLLVDRSRDRSRRSAVEAALARDDHQVPAHDGGVLDAVRRLEPRLRDVVLLHYYADLSVGDVARALRRPPGTVKRRLHEARARLATDLGEHR